VETDYSKQKNLTDTKKCISAVRINHFFLGKHILLTSNSFATTCQLILEY